jgi:hypothetical protein
MRQFHTGRCKAAAGLTEPRCASERGLATGGGRPAERRFTVGGSGKSVARCHRTVLAYWKFESISLQGLCAKKEPLHENARTCTRMRSTVRQAAREQIRHLVLGCAAGMV